MKNIRQYFPYIFNFILLYVLSIPGITKYYIALSIAVFVWLMIKMDIKKVHVLLLMPAAFYAVYGTIVAVFNDTISFNTFKEISLFVAPVLLAIPLQQYFCQKGIRLSEVNFWMLIPVYLLQTIPQFNTTDLLESMYAFIFGYYAVYYCYRRKFSLFLLASILSYLGHKRIGMLALIIGIIMVTILYKKIRYSNKFNIAFYMVLGVAVFYLIYMIENNFMQELMRRGIHPMGRDEIYNRFLGKYDFNLFFTGKGVGYVYNVLYSKVIAGQLNMHCDWLHLYIEIGFIGLIIYLGLFLAFILNTDQEYTGIIMQLLTVVFISGCSDNVAVYILTLYPLYVLILDVIYYKDVNDKMIKGSRFRIRLV